jgi:thymidylate synthase (FAD)
MKVTLNCVTNPILFKNMNIEEYLIYAARVSSTDRLNNDTAPKLMNYLIEHGHWSPFEMVSFGIEIETSRAIAQQMLRHRSFSFQEFSQRYAAVSDIEPVQLRNKAKTNRQSSSDATNDAYLDSIAEAATSIAFNAYQELLDAGVAKETARMILPLTTKTTVIMHGTLRSWIHFFDQRCSEHAQKEIRDIAFAARAEISKHTPWTAKALGWENDDE